VRVFPTGVGMSLDWEVMMIIDQRFPRVRGDEPSRSVLSKVHGLVFPTGVGIDRPQRRQTGQ